MTVIALKPESNNPSIRTGPKEPPLGETKPLLKRLIVLLPRDVVVIIVAASSGALVLVDPCRMNSLICLFSPFTGWNIVTTGFCVVVQGAGGPTALNSTSST